jgi:DNA-binding response OmpR family regulator
MSTVLVVCDDDLTRTRVCAGIKAEGYNVLPVRRAEEAEDIVEMQPERITAIVLDWQSRGISGLTTLRWLKAHATLKRTPVIVQTDSPSDAHIREGIDAGAFYYLAKPADDKLLHSIIRAAVEDYSYKEALLQNLAGCQNPFGMLQSGVFRLRTLKDAERIALWIANATPNPARAMGINEILINAVEHGNLGITYEEKTELLSDGIWHREVDRRLALPENAGKTVKVEVLRHSDRMTVRIEDSGPGFDYEQYLDFDETRVFDNHGRGIALTRAALDLAYEGTGNTVVVTIPFQETS